MTKLQGYIYRRADVTKAELRDLLGADSTGWSWTPAFMYTRGARRADDLLRGEEGCAYRDGVEIRWRPAVCPPEGGGGTCYEVLVLALAEQSLDGFAPLPPDGTPWQVELTTVRLQHPLGKPAKADEDESRIATRFIAPDGSIQFVALISDGAGGRAAHESV